MHKRLWNCLLVVAAFAGLAGLVALADPPQSGAQGEGVKSVIVANTPLPVIVTNTPLPVSGTVGISGTPNVNVSNMPIVGIDTLNNTVKIARDEEKPARHPDWEFVKDFVTTCDPLTGKLPFPGFPVPGVGKELVIEHFSASFRFPTGNRVLEASLNLNTSRSRDLPLSYFSSTFQGTGLGQDWFAISQQTRLYAGPGTTVSTTVVCTPGSPVIAAFTISGYLVDVP